MFTKTFLVAAFATFAAATPLAARTETYKCNTGEVKCCNQMHDVKSAKGDMIASLLSLNVAQIKGAIGLECTSLIGGAKCTSQTVCCDNTQYNGLVNVGCTPINIGL